MRLPGAWGRSDLQLVDMSGQVFQLGIPGQVPGELPPVPLSDDESPAKRSRGAKPAVNKNRGYEGKPAGTGAEPSGGAEKEQVLSLDMRTLEGLLNQQCERILKANREHSQGLLDALEERQAARFLSIERTVEGMEYTVEGFEARLKAVEDKLQRGIPREDEGRRRWTLVFGGWERDSRRGTILAELDQAIKKLGLHDDLDDSPFTTGPRRAVALANIQERKGETEADRKSRMHRIVTSFSQSQLLTSSKRKLWAGYSKSKYERDVASHCSWIRRTVATLADNQLPMLDCEYSTGTSWLGTSMLASVARDIPAGFEASDMIVNNRDGAKGWVNTKLLAKELHLKEKTVREGLESQRK